MEKAASVRLKAYRHTSISANQLFGVNTCMGLGRCDSYLILEHYFRIVGVDRKFASTVLQIREILPWSYQLSFFMSQKSYGGDVFLVDPLPS